MSELLQLVIWNVAWAGVLAVIALAVSMFVQHPFVVRLLWLCVLVKLLLPSPMYWSVPYSWVEAVSLPGSFNDEGSTTVERDHLVGESSESPLLHIAAGDGFDWQLAQGEVAAYADFIGPEGIGDRSTSFGHVDQLNLPAPSSAQPFDLPDTQLESPNAVAQIDWPLLIAIFWCLGSLSWLTITLRRMRRFGKRIALATPATTELRRMAQQLCEAFELRSVPEIRIACGRVPPHGVALLCTPDHSAAQVVA